MWLKVNNKEELQEGDIIELGTEYPLLLHYAVVVSDNGEQKVAHYPYPLSPCIQGIDYVLNNRPDNRIRRVFRTGLKSEQLIENHQSIEMPKKDFCEWLFSYNCESYVRQITGRQIGTDQRVYAVAGIIIIILFIVILINNK